MKRFLSSLIVLSCTSVTPIWAQNQVEDVCIVERKDAKLVYVELSKSPVVKMLSDGLSIASENGGPEIFLYGDVERVYFSTRLEEKAKDDDPEPPVVDPVEPDDPEPPVVDPEEPDDPEPPVVDPEEPDDPEPPVIDPEEPDDPEPPVVDPEEPDDPEPPVVDPEEPDDPEPPVVDPEEPDDPEPPVVDPEEPDDPEPPVIDPEEPDDPVPVTDVSSAFHISYLDGVLSLSGLQPGSKVTIYDLNAKVLMSADSNESGELVLALKSLQVNVVVVKTSEGTFKLKIK